MNAPHLAELRRIKQERLDALEKRAASLGIDAPQVLSLEIDQLKADMAAMETVTNPPVSEDVMLVLARYDQQRSVMAAVMSLSSTVAGIERAIDDDRHERSARQEALDVRFYSIDRRLWLLAGALVMLAALILVVLVIAALIAREVHL